ncbi:MAG TPA: GntR family transcriptional regulator [Pseudonocardiaceae bacterium]|nr:GntR family transcriptional regulator [Pseudonocardiaceae bacterium]
MTGPLVVVDAASGLAPWRQVHDQLVTLITAGTLAPGTRLPTIRQLAGDLGLAAGTIARTYRELEARGWVTTGRARGTVVAASSDLPDLPDPAAALRSLARDYAARARALGADEDVAAHAVRQAYREG